MTISPENKTDLTHAAPSTALAERYREQLTDILAQLTKSQRKVQSDRDEHANLLPMITAEVNRASYVRHIEVYDNALGQIGRHRDRIDGLLERTITDASSVFLPIGAVVSMKADHSFPKDDWGLQGGSYGAHPRKGSQGIVVGYNENREWAVKVAFKEDIVDANGEDVWNANIEYMMTIPFHAHELQVVALAQYVDGTPCRSVDFVHTHIADEDADPIMVVVSDGTPIEITAFDHDSGKPTYDAEAWSDLSPLEQYMPYDPSLMEACVP
jgi:hypothetical protein